MLAGSVVAVGVCADATVASNADAAKPATIYLVNMWFLPDMKLSGENTPLRRPFQLPHIFSAIKRGDDWQVLWNIAPVTRARQTVSSIAASRNSQRAIRTRPSTPDVRSKGRTRLPTCD